MELRKPGKGTLKQLDIINIKISDYFEYFGSPHTDILWGYDEEKNIYSIYFIFEIHEQKPIYIKYNFKRISTFEYFADKVYNLYKTMDLTNFINMIMYLYLKKMDEFKNINFEEEGK